MNSAVLNETTPEIEAPLEELIRRMEKAFFSDDFEESRRLRDIILSRLNEEAG